MKPRSTKAMVLELLSAAPGERGGDGGVSVQGLARAAAIFGVADNNLRVTLARLKRERLVATAGRGRYRLGSEARAVQAEVAAWRGRAAELCAWKGAWVAAHTAALGRSDRVALRRRARAFRLLGFRRLAEGLMLRPDNLRGSVDGLRARLDAMGVSNDVPVFRLSGFDAATERRALALWDAALLDRGYRRMTRALRDARHGAVESLDVASLERAAAHAFVLGGEAIRMIVLDPLLPDAIVDGAARAALFDAMRRYDEHGRALWRQVMSASEGAATALRQTHDG